MPNAFCCFFNFQFSYLPNAVITIFVLYHSNDEDKVKKRTPVRFYVCFYNEIIIHWDSLKILFNTNYI
jgi:hypothetical protein